MIFTPEHCDKILNGEKTQTRRIKKPDEWLAKYNNGELRVVCNFGRGVKWRTGQTYAVQPGRGKPAVGRYKLLDIREERLQHISIEDIKAEGVHYTDNPGLSHREDGYAYMQSWKWVWNKINHIPGLRWEDNPEVWVLTFELVEAETEAT